MDAEASYRIDCIMESVNSFLGGPWLAYLQGPVNDLKARELSNTIWVKMMEEVEKLLSKNSNPSFLVGNCLTLADITWGALLLKNALSENNGHRRFFAQKLADFPKVSHWSETTIKPTFLAWFD